MSVRSYTFRRSRVTCFVITLLQINNIQSGQNNYLKAVESYQKQIETGGKLTRF